MIDHTCLLCRCIYTNVTETHLSTFVEPVPSVRCVCPAAFFFLVLCICNEPEYLTEKDCGHTYWPLCAAQVTIESYTKETMPPDWILPTESLTFEVLEHKMDLAWQRHDLWGETLCKGSLFVVATFPYSHHWRQGSLWTDGRSLFP